MNKQYMYFIRGIGEPKDRVDAAKSLVQKMSTQAGPGAIILLTGLEHELAKNMIVIPIGPPAPELKCPHGIAMHEPCAKCERFGAA